MAPQVEDFILLLKLLFHCILFALLLFEFEKRTLIKILAKFVYIFVKTPDFKLTLNFRSAMRDFFVNET